MGKSKDKDKDKNKSRESQAPSNVQADYPVGYKKPPQHTQFKPGQSGNSQGRPKRPTTLSDVVREQLAKTITITVGGKSEKGTFLKAIVMKQVSRAANGDLKSAGMLLEIYEKGANDQGDPLRDVIRGLFSRHEAHEAADRTEPLPNETKAELTTVVAGCRREDKKS